MSWTPPNQSAMKTLSAIQTRTNPLPACWLISLALFIFQAQIVGEYRAAEAKQLPSNPVSTEKQHHHDHHKQEQQLRNISESNAPASARWTTEASAFQVPFIVLMSTDTIAVAQLPLIENGTVSVVYSLADAPEARTATSDEEGEDGVFGEENSALDDEAEDDEERRNQNANGTRKDGDHDADHGKSSGASSADAREYEQMPAETNSSMTSLGKSEWQQIAVGTRMAGEEIGTSPSSSSSSQPRQITQATSFSATSRKEEDVQGEEEAIRPRRRRRSSGNSLNPKQGDGADGDADGGEAQADSGNTSEASESKRPHYNDNRDAQAERTQANQAPAPPTGATRAEAAAAAESSGNVTSARVSVANASHITMVVDEELPASRLLKKEALAAVAAGALTEGSDKYSGRAQADTRRGPPDASNSVQFCDFDVHMSLGYAFVADSTGRIHRFSLLSSGARSGRPERFGQSEYQDYGPRRGGGASIMGGELAGNDLANTIDAGGRPESSRPAGGGEKTSALPASETNRASGSSNIEFDGDADDDHHERDGTLLVGASRAAAATNGVNRHTAADVLHEQADERRQHPTVYGPALSAAKDSSADATTTITSAGDAPISGESQQRSGATNRLSLRIHRVLSPLILLNLITTFIISQQFADEQLHLNAEQLLSPKVIWWRNKYAPHRARPDERKAGALKASHQVAGGGALQTRTNLYAQKHGRARNSTSGHDVFGGHRANYLERRQLRTEVVVDWLNNLLFVLDKYRLFVVDFDGNNELVLIDDFNANNRPVNLKVDPVNGFLFWLQIGKFHNTIYRLDLNVLSMQSATQKLVINALKLRQVNQSAAAAANNSVAESGSNFHTSDLVALSSHHYAHAKITNLPRHVKQFAIDRKHSRIYVPLSPAPTFDGSVKAAASNESTYDFERTNESTQRDDAEIFAPSDKDVTHLNSTGAQSSELFDIYGADQNCTTARELGENERGQILAYNLDGTDVGPVRTVGGKSHIASLDDMQDLTVDSEKGLLYWLKDNGKELFEEYKEGSSISAAQHNLDGSSYSKLIHFNDNGFNQPTNQKPRFNLTKIIYILANSVSTNRLTRHSFKGSEEVASGWFGRHKLVDLESSESSRVSRNAPFIILGITCLAVIAVYLIYAFVAQANMSSNENRVESIGPGSTYSDDLHVGVDSNGFLNSTISRWVGGTRPTARGEVSTLNRGSSTCNRTNQSETCDFESTNYGDASNAVDEHYRADGNVSQSNHLFGLDSTTAQLANLSHWPSNLHDLSNKLYVPVEVLQDEALNSIHRVAIDQLEIERKSPLGEGHFGMVLQGTMRCRMTEKGQVLHSNGQATFVATCPAASLMPPAPSVNQQGSRLPINSTASSSGHGSSSSTSCEFATANSCAEATTTSATSNLGDYLTPRSQAASSDYNGEVRTLSEAGSYSSYAGQAVGVEKMTIVHGNESMVETKLKVAIKKLKENASPEEKRDFLQEAKLLANFDHPNIVHLIGICLDRGSTYIVMELMLGGDLIRYMQENVPQNNTLSYGTQQHSDNLEYDDLLKICLDIVNGCCYLEERDYIHRDLAARNCLVSSRKREERVVKLADFGLARDIYGDSYYKKTNDSAMPLKWMAPECLSEQKFTKKSDVWSFGVVLWEVMSYCQEKPYGNVEPFFMKNHLDSGARLRKPTDCDENMYKLMNQCWKMDPENRPTFHECQAILIEIRNNSR